MKLIRCKAGKEIFFGVLEQDRIRKIKGSPFADFSMSDEEYLLSNVMVLPPVEPRHLIAVGKSYRKHIDEMASRHGAEPEYPVKPIFFFEAPGSIIGDGEPIVLPPEGSCKQVDLEGELAIVIGKKAKDVREKDALSFVLGYTIANDVSARGIPDIGGLWGIGLSKSLDTFTPLGPCIETDPGDPNNLRIVTRVNGETAQDSNTGDMIFSVEEFVSYCSSRMTLHPGDVIITGTPEGVRPIRAGDTIEISIDRIGTLKNPVTAR